MLETGGNATLEFVLGMEGMQWDIGETPPSSGRAELDLQDARLKSQKNGALSIIVLSYCVIGSFPSLYQSS